MYTPGAARFSPRLLQRYWCRAITSSFQGDAAWLQFTIYACRQLLSQRLCTLRFTCEVELGAYGSGFAERYYALLYALEDLSTEGELDELLAAESEADLARLRQGWREAFWRPELLRQLRMARRGLERAPPLLGDARLRDELRCRHERFMEANAGAAAAQVLQRLRGFVVLAARTADLSWRYSDALRGLDVLEHFEAFYVDHLLYDQENIAPGQGEDLAPALGEAAARLRQVPASKLLARTRIGGMDLVLRHVLSFYSEDVLVVAPERELVKERWPAGAKVLTPRLAMCERWLADFGRSCSVRSLAAAGTLAPLLLG